jgi:hypothetical protein
VLQARVGLQKRQIGKGGLGGLDFGALLGGMLGGGSKGPSNAPESKVAETQEESAVSWPGAKRVKVRYGPYRIPPISVSGNKHFHLLITTNNYCRKKT